jgi:hypothetical protein
MFDMDLNILVQDILETCPGDYDGLFLGSKPQYIHGSLVGITPSLFNIILTLQGFFSSWLSLIASRQTSKHGPHECKPSVWS